MKINKTQYGNLIKDLYINGDYIKKHPFLHDIDSNWKVKKIIPLIDKYMSYNRKKELNLLDVGGGAGLILDGVSQYIKEYYGIGVNKYAIDLSLDMLNIQKKKNPDLKKALNENICKTSLKFKEIDITLMIDVLEHIDTPLVALNELKRISNFVILKVPLENNIYFKILNYIKRGKYRRFLIDKIGHINIYNYSKILNHVDKCLGKIYYYYFTNVSNYYLNSSFYLSKMNIIDKFINTLSSIQQKFSSKISSMFFIDFIMILSKCY